MSAIETAREEVNARAAALLPVQEGLRDFARLDLQPETRAAVEDALRACDLLVAAMESFVAASDALLTLGYPDFPRRDVSDAALADLQQQLETLAAARAAFQRDEARTIGIVPGVPEPQ